MIDTRSCVGAGIVSIGLLVLASASGADGPPPPPRPGLTERQTKEAVKLAQGAMVELRKKTEGASAPGVDLREYVVGIELLSREQSAAALTKKAGGNREARAPQPEEPKKVENDKAREAASTTGSRAIVTSYRYFDDITVFSTVDLDTGRVVQVEAAQHLRTPLSQSEFEEAQELAREKSDEVKRLYERFGQELSVYPQFSQFTVKDDPRIHRVVHINFRVGKRDLSYPRPRVDLTTRQVETPPAPLPEPEPRPRRRAQ